MTVDSGSGHLDEHMSLRERGKAERRLRVVDAARAMLATEGVEGLSMRSLSEQSGVSVPTIYSLIGGRDDVLAAVLDQLGAVFDGEAAASPTEGLDRCFDIADLVLDTVLANAILTRSVVAEGLGAMLSGTDTSVMRRYAVAVIAALADACAAGELDDDAEPLLVAEQVVSLTAVRIFRWAATEPATDPDGNELRLAVTHGIGLLLAGSATVEAGQPVRARVHQASRELLGGTS